MQLLEPRIQVQIRDVSTIILPVLLAFLGIVFAGLFYLSQVVFDGLKCTGDKIDELITAYGRLLLDLLGGSILVSCFANISLLPSLVFWSFSFKITVDILRFVAIRGYIKTVHSKGLLIPKEYSEIGKFFRKLRNAGFIIWFMPGLLYFFTVAYPLAVSLRTEGIRFQLSQQALVIFLLSSTVFSFIQLYLLVTEALNARGILRNV